MSPEFEAQDFRRTSDSGCFSLIAFAGRAAQEKPTRGKACGAEDFRLAGDAGAALLAAAQSGDQRALLAIFGPDAKDILFSGDAVNDKAALQDFVTAYNQMNRWGKIKAGGETLYVGADNYAFPIPLARTPRPVVFRHRGRQGRDPCAPHRQRRVDRHRRLRCYRRRTAAILQPGSRWRQGQAIRAQVRERPRQARWSVLARPDGQTASPLGELGDFAKVAVHQFWRQTAALRRLLLRDPFQTGDKAKAAEDYIVDGNMTGGFAIVAYPAEYRNSGIMTFVVGKDGAVYQKDLGEKTGDIA